MCNTLALIWSIQPLPTVGKPALLAASDVLMSKHPVNIQTRMLAWHQQSTRAAAEVRQGFGNQLVSRIFNRLARNYNNQTKKDSQRGCQVSRSN